MLDRNDPQFIKLITRSIPLERLEHRLSPGGSQAESSGVEDSFWDYSEQGFLGVDESLLDIVHADWSVVEKYGTTHREIAELLTTAIKKYEVPNSEYTIKFIASSDGLQSCPWECKSQYSGNIIMVNHNLHQKSLIVVTELHPHLISEHYFFEGRKTIYRADPEILIPALNLIR